MAENGNGKKYISWQTVALAVCLLLTGVAGWAWSDTRSCIEKNKAAIEQKVDRTQYYRDVDEIKTRMERMDGKLDRLMQRGR